MKKRCELCVFAKIQITDNGLDIDLDKPLVCIKNGSDLPLKKSFLVDVGGINRTALGIEVEDGGLCEHFKVSKQMQKDIKDGCIK